jgi:ribosome-associated translation inhibitor RaiA
MRVRIELGNLQLEKREDYVISKRVRKLWRLCKMYGELADLRIGLDYGPLPEGYKIHLQLTLPQGTLVAKANNKKFSLAVTEVFDKLVVQLRKFKARTKKFD